MKKEIGLFTLLATPGFVIANFLAIDLVVRFIRTPGSDPISQVLMLAMISFSMGAALLELHFCEELEWRRRLLGIYPLAGAMFAVWIYSAGTVG